MDLLNSSAELCDDQSNMPLGEEDDTDTTMEEKRIIELKREKRTRKTAVTKTRHNLERLSAKRGDCELIQGEINALWEVFERSLVIMDELQTRYLHLKQNENKKSVEDEIEALEKEVNTAIEKAERVVKDILEGKQAETNEQSLQQTPPPKSPYSIHSPGSSHSHHSSSCNQRLKPLKVPVFSGEKSKFEDFWEMFLSLVDQSEEPPNMKMARLRQSLSGTAFEAIRGLGVTEPEYNEAKKILQSKFGGERRKLQAYMDQIEQMPPLKSTDVKSFERFADLVRIAVVKLQAEGRDGELGEGTFHSLLVKKLADRQVESYSRWLQEHKRDRSVVNLMEWLKEEVRIRVDAVEMAHGIEAEPRGGARDGGNFRNRTLFSDNSGFSKDTPVPTAKPPCVRCGGNHGVWSCKGFQNLGVKERWDVAKEKKLCFRCLASGHEGRFCPKARPCPVGGCKRSHHHLLHGFVQPDAKDERVVTPRGGAPAHTHTSTSQKETATEAFSLRTVPVWLKGNGRKVKVNALLDDGSNETFLNEEIAGVLGLKERYQTVKVNVLNNEVETFQSMPLEVTIESLDGEFCKDIKVKTCPKRVTGDYKVENWRQSKDRWVHLRECDFAEPAQDGYVDLLIGVDNADLHYSRADVRGEEGAPVARLGPLGWTCVGSPEGRQGAGARTHVSRTLFTREPTVSVDSVCCDVDRTLRRFWEVENCGLRGHDTLIVTEEENEALKKLKESIRYTGKGYKVGVPWKEDKPELPENRHTALIRLCNTENKLKKDCALGEEYSEIIHSYVEKGYLRRVEPEESSPPEVWYLPHFPVIRMDKTTTKVRIVFDCSAKTDGVSLNDAICAGPKLQKDLFDVLIRFRRNPVALACDIKEMYLQVEIEESDRPYFRLLWRDLDSSREPDVYEFSRVVFGKNSAPMEAQFVAQENARRHRHQYPLAAETVMKSTYMDDSIDSVETVREGIQLYKELDSLWGIAGMKARKWISNSSEVVEVTPKADRATELKITEGQEPVVKTLGVSWNSTSDTLNISTAEESTELLPTKRNVLKKVATVFDPLGLVSPFVIRAKILLQETWARGYDWDDVICDEVAGRIGSWYDQLRSLASVQVPRCLREAKEVIAQRVVTFVDASIQAYGTAVYLQCGYSDATTSSRLIASKSKVAPLKPMTVPRLELMGAVLGLRLTQHLIELLGLPMQTVTFYSDSMDVLWWVRGHGRSFRPFVANRVGEIQLVTEPAQWQHVGTAENPADLCTRGATPEELEGNSLWWQGPKWLLSSDKASWPKMDVRGRPATLPETKKRQEGASASALTCRLQEQKTEPRCNTWRLEPTRFSSWTRLVRLQARVWREVYNMRNPTEKITGRELLPEEIEDAEEEIISQTQLTAFPEEYMALSKGREIPKKSLLSKLCPWLDDQGVMRCSGRLQFAESLPYDVRFPIILPRGQWVTRLIVKHFHEMANHGAGTNFVLSQLSGKFWIVAAREEIRAWENECNECKRRKNKPATQIMGPLPQVRLRFTYRAFDQTAVDYAGPFTTIQGRGRQRLKRWLCVFTCLATRAVHLEVAWGLDTDRFLNALTRFTSRRGVPKEMISDNGTNFVGAVNELKELVDQLDKERIQRTTANKGIEWKFNPPGGPHFGGVHEIIVKAAKKAIYAVLGNSDITDEELITVVTGAEGLLNSRPLTYQTADIRDDVPLTPNHFLYGQMGGQFAPENVDTTGFNPRKRWRKVQDLISRVWSRWLKEYLPTLNARPKWTEVVKDLKEGDIVLVLDPRLPRGQWPLGRILETYPGQDGHSRVAKVQVGDKTVVRPIHKLVPLFRSELN